MYLHICPLHHSLALFYIFRFSFFCTIYIVVCLIFMLDCVERAWDMYCAYDNKTFESLKRPKPTLTPHSLNV